MTLFSAKGQPPLIISRSEALNDQFSDVSKPIFAIKYALEEAVSIENEIGKGDRWKARDEIYWRDLQIL